MDDSTKDLTSSARFETAIMSRAEPSRLPPRRGGHPSNKIKSAANRSAALARRGRVAVSCLGLLGALALPATAQAQTATTLVSNIGQGPTSTANASVQYSQRFTTGSHEAGYTLSSVDVISADAEGDSFSAKVCTVNASGHPTSTCTTLAAPASFAAGPADRLHGTT